MSAPRGRGRGRGGASDGGAPRGRGQGNPQFHGALTERPRGGGQSRGGGWGGDSPRGRGQSWRGGAPRGDFSRGGSSFRGAGGYRGRGGSSAQPRDAGPRHPESVPTPSEAITEFEDQSLTRKPGWDFAPRPAYLTKNDGTPFNIITNYFGMDLPSAFTIHRYSIEFTVKDGKSISRPKKRRVVQLLLNQTPFKGLIVATDYSNTILSAKDLPQFATPKSYTVNYYHQEEAPPKESSFADAGFASRRRFVVTVSKTDAIDTSALKSALTTPGNVPVNLTLLDTVVQCLNIIFARSPMLADNNLAALGRSRFFASNGAALALGQGLIARRGYFSSVRPVSGRLLINVNVSHGAFYVDGPLSELITNFGWAPRAPSQGIRQLGIFLAGVVVRTTHRRDADGKPEAKVFTILGLAPRGAGVRDTYFPTPSGPKSVLQYFKEQYPHVNLGGDQMPVVNVGTFKNPVYLPASVCTVLPGQSTRVKLTDLQTSNMITFSSRFPNTNFNEVKTDGAQMLGFTSDDSKSLKGAWGVDVDKEFVSTPALLLRRPTLGVANNRSFTVNDSGRWDWRDKKFFRAGNVGKWTVCFLTVPNRPWQEDDQFNAIHNIKAESSKYGVVFGEKAATSSAVVSLSPSPQERVKDEHVIDTLFASMRQDGVRTVVIFLPSPNKWLYSRIKFLLDVKYGIVNVCRLADKFRRNPSDTGLAANIALKLNAKCGGINQKASYAALDKDTMVLGLDVTHPTQAFAGRSQEDDVSVAAMTSSIDEHFATYIAVYSIQRARQEMVDQTRDLMVQLIRKWAEKNTRFPKKIIMYRDGVSESQYREVKDKELKSMKDAVTQVYHGKPQPKILLAVSVKRHHTRFLPGAENADPKTGNAKPGTLVDRHITGGGDRLFDFFLVSHRAIQGTARGVHYCVLENEMGMSAKDFVYATYYLSHVLPRSTTAVSLVAPALCADLACERARNYMYGRFSGDTISDTASQVSTGASDEWDGKIHPNVEDRMFYL